MTTRLGPPALTIGSTWRRSGATLTVAVAVILLVAATAFAAPTGATPTAGANRGLPLVVDDVLGPTDPAYWNSVVAGTRVLTSVDPATR